MSKSNYYDSTRTLWVRQRRNYPWSARCPRIWRYVTVVAAPPCVQLSGSSKSIRCCYGRYPIDLSAIQTSLVAKVGPSSVRVLSANLNICAIYVTVTHISTGRGQHADAGETTVCSTHAQRIDLRDINGHFKTDVALSCSSGERTSTILSGGFADMGSFRHLRSCRSNRPRRAEHTTVSSLAADLAHTTDAT